MPLRLSISLDQSWLVALGFEVMRTPYASEREIAYKSSEMGTNEKQ